MLRKDFCLFLLIMYKNIFRGFRQKLTILMNIKHTHTHYIDCQIKKIPNMSKQKIKKSLKNQKNPKQHKITKKAKLIYNVLLYF